MEWDKVRGASLIELGLDWTYQLKEITIAREDSVENNENTVDSTIIKLLKGVNQEDLKEKLVEGFTVEKSGDIIERERESQG